MSKRSTKIPDEEFSNKSQKLKSDEDEDTDEDEQEDEEEECPICREGFTELNPPYPIGDKCEVQPPYPKHKYHSHCLSAAYHSLPANSIANRKACPLCGTDRSAHNDNYGITQELIDDVDARTAQELLAVQAAQAAAYAAAHPEEVAQAAFDAAHPHAVHEESVNRRAVAEQRARLRRYQEGLDEEALECEGTGCNIMGGKFRKSRRKTKRRKNTKRRKSTKRSSRKSNRKSCRKNSRKKL